MKKGKRAGESPLGIDVLAGKSYFYDKLYVKEKLKLVEELLITNEKYFYSYF